MLRPSEKKYFTAVMQYFFDTTNTSFEDFIELTTELMNNPQTEKLNSSYSAWLLSKCFEVLKLKNISPSVCIENKDVVRSIAVGEQSRNEGEFYTPEVWCEYGRRYMKAILGDLWGQANVWDIACGTGNLMRTAGYSSDKLFLSTLLDEDLISVRKTYPDATIFQLDACNGIDYDAYNMLFSMKLPDNLRKKLEANEPLVFYINPPYRVGFGGANDIAQHMTQMGFGRSAVDIYHHFLYRICLLIDTYKLTNCHVGVFGPTGWLQSRVNYAFRDFIFEHLKFRGGMSFPASEFANVGDGNDWLISMSVWSSWTPEEKVSGANKQPQTILLDACDRSAEGKITVTGSQLIKPTNIRLHDWCQPKDVTRYRNVPTQTSGFNFGSSLQKEPENTLMTLLSENTVIDGTRRAAMLSFTHTTSVPVTAENFWRCVASFGARNATDSQDAFLGRQIFSAPNTELDGWNNFLADSLALVLFCRNSFCFSYRDIEVAGVKWVRNNNFFPIGLEDCRKIITDPVLLADMEAHPSNNRVIIEALEWAAPYLSEASHELIEFGLNKLVASLTGTVRKDVEYKNWLYAYDASLQQVRTVSELWSESDTKLQQVYTSKIKALLKPQITEFGFLIGKGEKNIVE